MVQTEIGQRFFDGLNLTVEIPRAGIRQMQQDIGVLEFFQCRSECAYQIFWKIPNEPDGIGNNDLAITWKSQASARGVECFKGTILSRHMAIRQCVEKGGFSHIGIADNRNHRQHPPKALCAPLIPVTSEGRQLSFQVSNPVSDSSPIRF